MFLSQEVCRELWCTNQDDQCVTNSIPASDGTPCTNETTRRKGVCVKALKNIITVKRVVTGGKKETPILTKPKCLFLFSSLLFWISIYHMTLRLPCIKLDKLLVVYRLW